MKYKVTFYQCGVEGFDAEHYDTKAEAQREAVGFLRAFLPMVGHRYSGSIYRDGFARIVDRCNLTEAGVTVHTNA